MNAEEAPDVFLSLHLDLFYGYPVVIGDGTFLHTTADALRVGGASEEIRDV